ncbi:DUF4365 domain-containing protein [Blastococcus goldschmidtiae]|uniref:DUF4365 domain-containing protein n=1 Tax=Blastococcus goldschmidtiae TaxID=3075546 RepID=A0ABU2K5U1_9ACTN|nr:DUF4365 domain-containing protein [Blastococcus sp. DSM 46792]MDT0275537.1 DUF4365 domain-containing protein [Blastococcus sp. DSM 46792]
MPGRTRDHELETASERALEQLLPEAWTVAPVQHDYGIDRRVEIFEEQQATGLGFLVQLKGTDADLPKALSEPFKVSALNYMQIQSESVLVVRYNAPTGSVFGFWMHRRDVILKKDDQKTATLRWALSDELTKESARDLLLEVQRYRSLSSVLDEGRPLRIDLVSSEALSLKRLSISRIVRTLGRPFVLVEPGEQAEIQLQATSEQLSADLAISSSTASISGGTPASTAADLMLLTAVSLSKIGRSALAVEVLRQCRDATLLGHPETAAVVANFLVLAKAWRTGAQFLNHPSLLMDHSFAVILATGFSGDETVTAAEAFEFSEAFMARSNALHDVGESALAAGYAYTAGNTFFHRSNAWALALTSYKRAYELDPSYGSRAYFCGELAAANFECGNFTAATDWYSRAIDLQPDEIDTLACRADAFAYAGQYLTASEDFAEYFRRPSEMRRSIWGIKARALEIVRKWSGVEEQQRDGVGLAIPSDTSSFVANLQRDSLHIPSWEWLLQDALNRGDENSLADPLITIVAFGDGDVTAEWILLGALALESGDVDFFEEVIKSQWARRSEGIVDDVVQVSEGLPEGFLPEFERVVASLREQPREFTIRLLEGGELKNMMKVDLSWRPQT